MTQLLKKAFVVLRIVSISVYRIFPIIGGIAGVYALFFPIIQARSIEGLDQSAQIILNYTVWYLWGSALVIAFLIVTILHNADDIAKLTLDKIDYELSRYRLERVSAIVHNLSHEVRNQIFQYTAAKNALSEAQTDEEKDALKLGIEKNWGMFNLFYLDNVKEAVDTTTGQKNSICLKIRQTRNIILDSPSAIVQQEDKPASRKIQYVNTLYRDTLSYRLRRENDIRLPRFDANANSAFSTILSGDTSQYFYLSNDLSQERSYVNANPRWKEFYNSTLVVPIRIERQFPSSDEDLGDEHYHSYGFLCADSLKAKYRSDVELELMLAFSDLYFPVLYAFHQWRKAVGDLSQPQPTVAPASCDDITPSPAEDPALSS